MNHAIEKVWTVDSIQRKSNQYSVLRQEMLELKKEIREMKDFFTNRILALETENEALKIQAGFLSETKVPEWDDFLLC